MKLCTLYFRRCTLSKLIQYIILAGLQLCFFMSQNYHLARAFSGILLFVGVLPGFFNGGLNGMLLIRRPFQALYRFVGVLSGYSSRGRNGLLPIQQPFQALHQIRGVLSGYSSGGRNGLLPIRQPFQALRQIAGFFPGTPMEAITDCYLHEAFSGIVHVRGVLSVFFSEDCQQIVTRFLYESTSYGFALT